MWQVLVVVSLVLSARAPSYALLPRKSHAHRLALGNTLRLPLAGPAQELLLSGPGYLLVGAQRRADQSVRVYVREAGVIDEVVVLTDAASADITVPIARGAHAIEVVGDAEVPGTIFAKFASEPPRAPASEPSSEAALDEPPPLIAIAPAAPDPDLEPEPKRKSAKSTMPISVKGRQATARLDAGETVLIIRPGHPLHLALAPTVAGLHLLLWRTISHPSTHLLVHADGHLLMSAVLMGSDIANHLNEEIGVANAEDLLVEPKPGTHQLLIESDGEVAAKIGR